MSRRFLGLIKKILRGEDPLVARQSVTKWNDQYQRGTWDYLVEDTPPNAVRLTELIAHTALPRRILDMGCGNGGLYFALKQKGVTVDYVGVDFSQDAIAQAREKFPKAKFFVGDAQHPEGEWGSGFDLIIFNEVIYYVPAIETLDKYAGLLTPNGKIVVSMYRSLRTWIIAQFLKFKKHAKIETIPAQRGYPAFFISMLSRL